jgi:hypothetical protein
VDIEEGGVNGLVVRSLTRGGTLARDGRIQPGDYLVNVNGENLRSVSQAAALAVLRRTQLVPQGESSTEHQQGMIFISTEHLGALSIAAYPLRYTCTNSGTVPYIS